MFNSLFVSLSIKQKATHQTAYIELNNSAIKWVNIREATDTKSTAHETTLPTIMHTESARWVRRMSIVVVHGTPRRVVCLQRCCEQKATHSHSHSLSHVLCTAARHLTRCCFFANVFTAFIRMWRRCRSVAFALYHTCVPFKLTPRRLSLSAIP